MHSAARKLPPQHQTVSRSLRARVRHWSHALAPFERARNDVRHARRQKCSSSRPSPSPPPRARSSRRSPRRPRPPSRARRSTTSSRRSRASRRSRTPRPTTALIRSALPRSPTPASACRKMNCSARTTCATPSYAMVASRCSPRPRGRSRNSRTRRWPSSRARRSFCRTAARPRSSTEASSRAPCRRSC